MEPLDHPCPVPPEQQPLQEYEALRRSWFFSWAGRPWPGYLQGVAWVWGCNWLLVGPVVASSFPPLKSPGGFLLGGTAGTTLVLGLVLLRLYLGWIYVRSRLNDHRVVYEESGWYDGQTWTKPKSILDRDRLIVTYQVQPLLSRLKYTLGVVVLVCLSCGWGVRLLT